MNAVRMYRCHWCKGVHVEKSDAQKCCIPAVREVQVCSNCGEEYSLVVAAGQCCQDQLDRTEASNFGSMK